MNRLLPEFTCCISPCRVSARFILTRRILGSFFLLTGLAFPAWSDESELALSWDRTIQPLVGRHCYHCHRDSDVSGNVNLQRDENPRMIVRNRKKWETVLQVLRSEEMPPEEGRTLKSEDREKIITFLDTQLGEIDCSTLKDPGTPAARRLTRHEYNLAVEDLTGLPIRPATNFPPEPISFGFVGIGAATGLTPVEVNHYYAAADSVADALVLAAETDKKLSDHFFGPYEDFDQDSDQAPKHKSASDRLRRFADRAFRRPADQSFLDGLDLIYLQSIQHSEQDAANSDITVTNDERHVRAMRDAMSAVLMSPRFFMRIETPPGNPGIDDPTIAEAYPVDAYDYASRLSYFLWSSPPDEELRQLAETGQLTDPVIAKQQVERMLKDRRTADGLVRGFFAQWLQFDRLPTHQVDSTAFPEATTSMLRSMRREVERVLTEIIRKNRPITDIIDCNYTFVDTRLADFYGLTPINEPGFHRVSLSDRRRGGLVVSAALLTLQSDPARTNVPRRGNYIAGTFFGDPPPPPPPDVPELITDDENAKSVTLRELLEKHRESPQCATCHAQMDPIGFALENYDAIGRWRTEDAGQPIDPSGELPNDVKFSGPEGLKDLLLARKEDMSKALIENLMIYALGRGPREVDPCVVEDALDSLAENEDRFSSLILTITQSFPFTHRSDFAF
ncbi:DUF1592 domain-containing protein [Rubripirellula reticaptiva]|uniref:Planctomycete cytochrome C n=1 Tax=Rubripirellula reticaptiva TaxID=2528013 RepID=A0A5C6F1Y9_9BACT|nr:DUF1592 domain-containing protein [Rubripirellula reticaptiva]TWU55262.1 hypothetical protein Poly59_15590 [Rubripirellula reticaptiva]